MVRLECHKCKRLAFTGELKLENDEQIFICWRCKEKAELERAGKLKTESEEEQIPDMPPSGTEKDLMIKYQQDKLQELIEEYERIRKLAPNEELVFGPYQPNYGPPWTVTAENDLVNRQVWTENSK